MTEQQSNELILYQPDNTIKIEVRLENETVWLTQAQMVMLFERNRTVITKHIKNIFQEGELDEKSNVHFLHIANSDKPVKLYNLDVIISVGYRVKSQRGTAFRRWATKILKEYIIRGYAVNKRFEQLEYRVLETEKKIDFFVKTALPPLQGVFFEGQIFDAYVFVSDLIKSAKNSIVLIDNYIDESVLLLLSKRLPKISAVVYTKQISPQIQLDVIKHNLQYEPVTIHELNNFHDRFLLIDEVVYHFGASLKDLGKKMFAFSKMEFEKSEILKFVQK